MIWRDVVDRAISELLDAGHTDALMQARWLAEQASGNEGSEYFGMLGTSPTTQQLARFDGMLKRRLAGEPLQYVLGSWGFRGLDIMVSPAVLIPRPETEMLAELAIDEVNSLGTPERTSPILVVDLGTGSGAVGLAVAAECPKAQVLLTDISTDALAVAQANMAGLGSTATRVSISEGSWYEALPQELAGKVDVLVSNPPYVGDSEPLPDEVVRWEPEIALRGGTDGLEAARSILAGAVRWLVPAGLVLLELAPAQISAAKQLAEANGLVADAVYKDLAGHERVLACRC